MTGRRATRRWAWLVVGMVGIACHKGDKAAQDGEAAAGEEHTGPVACGAATCGEGQICCNPSCGICTPPDGMCTQQFCDEPADEVAAGPKTEPAISCDNVRCAAGTHCELTEVQCVRAPCPPVPECRPDADAGT